jgi:hypothetical protein
MSYALLRAQRYGDTRSDEHDILMVGEMNPRPELPRRTPSYTFGECIYEGVDEDGDSPILQSDRFKRNDLCWERMHELHELFIEASWACPLIVDPRVVCTGTLHDERYQAILWWNPVYVPAQIAFRRPQELHVSLSVGYWSEGSTAYQVERFVESQQRALNALLQAMILERWPADRNLLRLVHPPKEWGNRSLNFSPDSSWVLVCQMLQGAAEGGIIGCTTPYMRLRARRPIHNSWC